jgi:hypothetical protein
MGVVHSASTNWVPDEWELLKKWKDPSPEEDDDYSEPLPEVHLDIGRLTKAERNAITATRDGQPASSIFAVLALWLLCQKRSRIAPPPPSAGYTLWAVDDVRSGACAVDRSRGISLCNAFEVVRSSGVASLSSYSDEGGRAAPSLTTVLLADESPFFRFRRIDQQKPHVLVDELKEGRGFVFAWGYTGFLSRLVSIIETKARVAREPEADLDDDVEWTTAVIIGYDPLQCLFYGHAPVGVSGSDDLLVAFTPTHIADCRFATSFWTGELYRDIDEESSSFYESGNLRTVKTPLPSMKISLSEDTIETIDSTYDCD